MSQLQDLMHGHWRPALIQLGIPAKLLDGHNRPCPVCGGTDRFSFNDPDRGLWYCRGCEEGGDAVKLAMKFTGLSFRDLAKTLEGMVGKLPAARDTGSDDQRKLQHAAEIWRQSQPGGKIVEAYLRSRGFTGVIPPTLREHPALEYSELKDGKRVVLGTYPAMVAQILAAGGKRAVGIHRTYLTPDGNKAPVGTAKKSLGAASNGSAIHLHSPLCLDGTTPRLGLAEGIETALAASQLREIPVWACVSAGGLEAVEIPGSIGQVLIFADHDHSRTGLKASSALAYRLLRKGHDVQILMPMSMDSDWADILSGKVPYDYLTL